LLEARDLTKRSQTLLVVDGVSFTINPGEILGYLGPNGSGKSTTIVVAILLLVSAALRWIRLQTWGQLPFEFEDSLPDSFETLGLQ
jgi:ABC-type lipopolysaccharide export system ATPase subunit